MMTHYTQEQVDRLAKQNVAMCKALRAFLASERCIGWKEGDCDLWLGPIWEQANDALNVS